jgi:hypothetical protein
MDDQQINERLAEIMEWKKKTHTQMAFLPEINWEWVNKKGEMQFLVDDWQPDKDWNQLMQVVEKVIGDGWMFDFSSHYQDNINIYFAQFTTLDLVKSHHVSSEDPRRAIAEALIKAVG